MTSEYLYPEIPVPETDLVDSSNYITSPLETLVESVQPNAFNRISIHDLLHAYNILSSRIRLQVVKVTTRDRPWPALKPLQMYSAQVICALRRDIRRILVPGSLLNSGTLNTGDVHFEQPVLANSDPLERARDVVDLTHQALRLLSDIFRFPLLYAIFTTGDIDDLLNDLLEIANASSLLTRSAGKTTALAIWVLQTQRLPSSALYPKIAAISVLLMRNLDNQPGKHGKSEKICDSLKMIHNLLAIHALQFFPPLSRLLPLILPHLLSTSPKIRLQASHALNGFVLAKIKSTTSACHLTLTTYIQTFLNAQMSKFKSNKAEVCLPTLIKSALMAETTAQPGDGPFWAINTLASLIMLSDASLFSHPRSLKFFLPLIAQAHVHRRSTVRSLHPRLWHCLVWAFSRMIHVTNESGDEDFDFSIDSGDIEIAERAFLLVKQEINSGTGLALAAVVIRLRGISVFRGPRGLTLSNPISKALTVIDEMVSKGDSSTSAEGVAFLAQVLGAIGFSQAASDDHWNCNDILTGILFDGALLNTKASDITTAVRAMSNFKMNVVTRLSEVDVVQNWGAIASIWSKSVERTVHGNPDVRLSSDLLHIWQSLLLVHTQLTQERGHLTTTAAYADQFSAMVTKFLFQENSPTAVRSIQAQLSGLLVAGQLWGVMKNVFSAALLSVLAEKILAAILENHYDLSDEQVKTAWSVLCSDLMIAEDAAFLLLIHVRDENQKEEEIQRQLWLILAKTIPPFQNKFTWEDIISLSHIPLAVWNMSDRESQLWEGIFQCAVSRAGAVSIRPTTVVEKFVEKLSEDKLNAFSGMPKLILSILSHIVLIAQDQLPVKFLSLVDLVLHDLYPPQPELLPTCIRFLQVIQALITSISPIFLITLLGVLHRSLFIWIADESEVLLEEEYNTKVIPLYCDALSILQCQEPSFEILNSTASFLTAAFIRAPPPLHGPLAFANFWKATYHHRHEFRRSYPPDIKECLKGVQFVFGGILSDGFSDGVSSQSPSTSIVPDSQISPKYFIHIRRSPADLPRFLLRLSSGGSVKTPGKLLFTPESRNASDISSPLSRMAPYPKFSLSPEVPTPSQLAINRQLRKASKVEAGSARSLGVLHPVLNSGNGRHTLRDQRTDANEKTKQSLLRTKRVATDSSIERSNVGTSSEPVKNLAFSAPGNHRQRPKRNRPAKQIATSSEAEISPIPGASTTQPRAQSDPIGSRKRALFDGVEVLTYRAFLKKKRRAQEPGSRAKISNVERCLDSHDKGRVTTAHSALHHFDRGLGNYPPTNDVVRTPPRSQTVPILVKSPALWPLRRSRTTSARLNALQEAYTAVTHHPSQMLTEDLLQATRLANQISTALNEQIGKKLVGRQCD